jgi:lipoyl(octanoyl) transferase
VECRCLIGMTKKERPEPWPGSSPLCGREDSNFHPLSGTATSTLRVYQFRHDRTVEKGLSPSRERAGSKSGGACEAPLCPFCAGRYALLMQDQDRPNYRAEPVEWRVTPGLVPYPDAVAEMEARVAAMHAGIKGELVWLLEHPPLYTAGTSAKPQDLKDHDRFDVFPSARGGQYTYHGPGQRVAYVMLDLSKRKKDVRRFVQDLEAWVIGALGRFGVKGELKDGRVGVWVDRTRPAAPRREDKIAAIGVRIRRWVSFHGVSLNVEPDLSHFGGIVPCGIAEEGLGVTSLVDLGRPVGMDEADAALRASFEEIFGPTIDAPPPLR